jgi:hypothetical protein
MEEKLYEMLDIALDAMNENELCSYCAFAGTEDCFPCRPDDICKQGLFTGLSHMAEKRMQCV